MPAPARADGPRTVRRARPPPPGGAPRRYHAPVGIMHVPTRGPDEHRTCRAILAGLAPLARELEEAPHPRGIQALPLVLSPLAIAALAQAGAAAGPARYAWVAFAGWMIALLGTIGHECLHQAYSHDARVNRWMGTFVFAHTYMSYEAYRALHVAHHLNTGFDADPSGDSPKYQGKANLVSHVLLVLLGIGFPLFQILPGWLAGFGLAPKDYPGTVRSRIRQDLAVTAAFHALLWWGLGPEAYGLYPAAFMVGSIIIINMFGFNHVFTERYTECVRCNTRNIETGPVVAALTLYAGHHVEHHFAPAVPWYRLPVLHDRLAALGGTTYSVRGFLGAHLDVLKVHLAAWLPGRADPVPPPTPAT